MIFEQIIKGTPAQFAAMVEMFSYKLQVEMGKGNAPQYDIAGAPRVDPLSPLVKILFINAPNESKGLGGIGAQALPDNRTLLTVSVDDQYWPTLQPAWKLLHVEIKRLGLIDQLIDKNNSYDLPEYKVRLREKIKNHWEKGDTYLAISYATGVSLSTVKRRLKEMGLTGQRRRKSNLSAPK